MLKNITYYCFLIACLTFSSFIFAKKLKFVAEELPPFHYYNAQKEPVGVLVDVLNALLKQTNIEAEIELIPFARSLDLTEKNADVLMFSFLKTPSREQKFKWIGQVYTNKAYLVGLKNRNDIKLYTLNDAKDYVTGTIRGYYSETFLRNNDFKTQRNLYLTVNYNQLWGMLMKKRIDFILTNTIALGSELESLKIQPSLIHRYIEIEDFPNQLFIAAGLATSDETIKTLSDALNTIKQNGTYKEILTKWNMN